MSTEQENVPASALRPGDLVTETTTPDGPWYRVVAVDLGAGTVTVDADGDLTVDVDVRSWADPVLRRSRRGPQLGRV